GRVAEHHLDGLEGLLQAVGDDLLQHGHVALAVWRRSRQHRNLAVLEHAHRDALKWPKPRALDIGAQAYSDVAAFSARRTLALRKIGQARQLKRAFERGRI